MKDRKYLSIWITIIILANILAGCSWYPDGTTYNVGDDSQVQVETNESGNIKGKLTANVDIDAKVDIPDDDNWKNYSVESRMIDVSRRETTASLFESKDTAKISEMTNKDGTIMAYSYQFPSGNILSFSKGSIGYNTLTMIDRTYDRYIKGVNGIRENINDLFPYKELDGISRDASIKKVQDVCAKLNIEISSEPDVYAVDYEHAQTIADSDSSYSLDKKGNLKNNWTKDNNAYVIIYRICMNGIPITDSSYFFDSGNASYSKVKAIVNKDGIISFNASGIYDVSSESIVSDKLCNLSDVMKILESRYYYSTSNSQTKIAKISLEYVPVYTKELQKYNLKPYWVCKIDTLRVDVKDENESSFLQRKTVFIDAVAKTVLN